MAAFNLFTNLFFSLIEKNNIQPEQATRLARELFMYKIEYVQRLVQEYEDYVRLEAAENALFEATGDEEHRTLRDLYYIEAYQQLDDFCRFFWSCYEDDQTNERRIARDEAILFKYEIYESHPRMRM